MYEILKKYDAIGVAGSYLRDSKGRTVSRFMCSCGKTGKRITHDHSSWYSAICPSCGGRLVFAQYNSPTSIQAEINGDILKIKEYSLNVKLDSSDNLVWSEDEELFAEYKKVGNRLKCISCEMMDIYNKEISNMDEIKAWCGEDVAKLIDVFEWGNLSAVNIALFIASHFPKAIKEAVKYPTLAGFAFETCYGLFRQQMKDAKKSSGTFSGFTMPSVFGASSIPVVNENWTFKDILENMGLHWDYIMKNDKSTPQAFFLVTPDVIAKWANHPKGGFIVAKHMHGNIDMRTMMFLILATEAIESERPDIPGCVEAVFDNAMYKLRSRYYYRNTFAVTQEEKNCWWSFVSDCIDQYPSTELYNEFINRIKALRDLGVLVTDETIRTKTFSKLQRESNFRMISSDVSFDDIDKDPLKVIANMKVID